MAKYKIDIDKVYSFPEEISVIEYDGFFLVVAPKFANWIVLNSMSQVEVFNYLKENNSIAVALANSSLKIEDVNYVVTQVEARRFTKEKAIHSSTEDERSLHIYLTNHCNLVCPRCYMNSGVTQNKELSTFEIKKLISDYKRISNGTSVTFSGGEPTSHPDFDMLVKYTSELGLEVKILSNGTLLSPERIAKLAKYIASIQISIDGYSEESNAIIRGKGSFKQALLAVDTFVKYGVCVTIAVTPPMSILKEHVNDYVVFAQLLSEKYKGMPFRVKFAEELLNGRDFMPSTQYLNEYLMYMQEIQKRYYGKDYDVKAFVSQFGNDNVLDNCMFGNLAVASNGDVFCCARIGDLLPIANVRTTPLEEIVMQAKKAEKVSLITNLEPCNRCELQLICGGGCRIEEFPQLVKRSLFENVKRDMLIRKCNSKIKYKFYDLMLRSNKYFYRALT